MYTTYSNIFIFIFSFLWFHPLYAETTASNRVQYIIDNSTFSRIGKPIAVRTDRKTLEYFIEHVEELTKHGKDFNRKELILGVKGNGKYGIQMPSKHITGEFELIERQPHKVIYVGHGNAIVFFSFSGTIVLEINYTTQKDEKGYYEEVKTVVHLKFDNAILGFLAKAASPVIITKLDKLISKFSTKTKKVVEAAYANKKGTK
ncbi:MAG TPA: hypothetical protein ACFYD4_04370 [Candidatus Wunengus sp. YC61]|uniref:hypothetical protein n=1 Tax=Candidatus Wunengus sp. YC61 TaxID=3367698 RepID=UPI00402864B7